MKHMVFTASERLTDARRENTTHSRRRAPKTREWSL